jgi:ribonuclease P protein component
MLASENRLLKPDDFRTTMKSGRKVSSAHLVIYLKRVPGNAQARFGFVVGKIVGGAVQRNLVKRRLRAGIREQVIQQRSLPENEGIDLVVRALPGAAQLDWHKLSTELEANLIKALGPANA